MQQKVQVQNKEVERKYIREDLLLGSFILHSHLNTNSCFCNRQCKYILMNQQRQMEDNEELYHKKQIYEQSKNKGYPQSLIKATLKSDISMFDFLIQIYSTYLHLEIEHNVFAELAMQTTFESSQQKNEFIDSWQGPFVIIFFRDVEFYYEFTIINLKGHQKSEEEDVIKVLKSNKPNKYEEKPGKRDKLVTQNEWIVLFQWILFNKKLIDANWSFQFEPIISKLKQNSQALQAKLNSIRTRSYTRLYNLSCFYER